MDSSAKQFLLQFITNAHPEGPEISSYQLIFGPRITSPPAIYTNQYFDTLPASYTSVPKTSFHLQDYFYRWYVR